MFKSRVGQLLKILKTFNLGRVIRIFYYTIVTYQLDKVFLSIIIINKIVT